MTKSVDLFPTKLPIIKFKNVMCITFKMHQFKHHSPRIIINLSSRLDTYEVDRGDSRPKALKLRP